MIQSLQNGKDAFIDVGEPTMERVGEVVYWTSKGKKYHSNPSCSNMNSPMSGTISESGRTPCKKCY